MGREGFRPDCKGNLASSRVMDLLGSRHVTQQCALQMQTTNPAAALRGVIQLEEVDHVEIKHIEDLDCLIRAWLTFIKQTPRFSYRKAPRAHSPRVASHSPSDDTDMSLTDPV